MAVIARGSPVISIIAFKQNENKLYHFNSINMCPELENTDELEKNEGQTYLKLPSESKLSLDCEFLQVTTFDGSVIVIKMPPIIDPMQNQTTSKAPAGAAGDATPTNGTPENLMAPS